MPNLAHLMTRSAAEAPQRPAVRLDDDGDRHAARLVEQLHAAVV